MDNRAAATKTISFNALQRARTTIADLVASYFPYVGLKIPEDFFKHMDVLVFVEATIYQLDEDNEALASQGIVEPYRHLIEESVLPHILSELGLLDDGIMAELHRGDVYWEGERRLCASMRQRGRIPKLAPACIMLMGPTTNASLTRLHGESQEGGQPIETEQQQGGEQSPLVGMQQQQCWDGVTLDEVLTVHESKSFDYRVLHLLLWKLTNRQPDPSLLKFLKVDELLVDISDDLTDYEDDVDRNSFNIYRCYAHLFGPDAPRMLIQRISELEEQHASLLAALPQHLQGHWLERHKHASAEGGHGDGTTGGSWEFPSVIYDEAAFREDDEDRIEGDD